MAAIHRDRQVLPDGRAGIAPPPPEPVVMLSSLPAGMKGQLDGSAFAGGCPDG